MVTLASSSGAMVVGALLTIRTCRQIACSRHGEMVFGGLYRSKQVREANHAEVSSRTKKMDGVTVSADQCTNNGGQINSERWK